MKFQCQNVKCQAVFPLPSTYVIKDPETTKAIGNLEAEQFISRSIQATGYESEVRIPCCPICWEHNIEEVKE